MSHIGEHVRHVPKVDLYVHLEAAIRPATLLRLAERHSVKLPADTALTLANWYRFRSYTHFLEVGLTINSCIRTAQDLEEVAKDFLVTQWEDQILYSEVAYTPHSLADSIEESFHNQIDAINRARAWAARELGVGMGLIVDIPPRARITDARGLVECAVSRRSDGVVAVGIDCCGTGELPDALTSILDFAAEAGVPAVVYIGDNAGSESVWNAIEATNPVRLVNPAAAVGDLNLSGHLLDANQVLTFCPTACVKLGSTAQISDLRFPALLSDGLPITLATGWPCLLETTLSSEYEMVYDAFAERYGWSTETFGELVLASVRATLLPPHDRDELERRCLRRIDEIVAESQRTDTLFR